MYYSHGDKGFVVIKIPIYMGKIQCMVLRPRKCTGTLRMSKDEQSLQKAIIFSLRNTEALVSSQLCLMRAQLCTPVLLTAEREAMNYTGLHRSANDLKICEEEIHKHFLNTVTPLLAH